MVDLSGATAAILGARRATFYSIEITAVISWVGSFFFLTTRFAFSFISVHVQLSVNVLKISTWDLQK